MTRPRTLLLAVALIGGVLLIAGSILRVPPNEIAATSRGWAGPGLHFRVPFTRSARIPATGTIEIAPVEAPTPAGAVRSLSVRLDYRIGPDAPPELAREVLREGLTAALAPVLSHALANHLRSAPDARLPRTGSSGDPIGAALVSVLAAPLAAEDLERRLVGAPCPASCRLRAPRRKLLISRARPARLEIALH